MHFSYDALTKELRWRLLVFMDEHLIPAEAGLAGVEPGARPPELAKLGELARERGLWNLCLPHPAFGPGLTSVQYAPLAEITGRSPLVAPAALNCDPPDSAVMNVLAEFGTRAQQARWLSPLLAGEVRTGLCLDGPRLARRGRGYVLDGPGRLHLAASPGPFQLLVVMGEFDDRRSIVLLPADAPGITVGSTRWTSGHALGGQVTVRFAGVPVPAGGVLGGEGDGSVIVPAILGPAWLHHCMRLVGMAGRALELLPAGQADQGRIRIEQARLLTLKAAWLIDTEGELGARAALADARTVVPATAEWVLSRALRAAGNGPASPGFPLDRLLAHTRRLRRAVRQG